MESIEGFLINRVAFISSSGVSLEHPQGIWIVISCIIFIVCFTDGIKNHPNVPLLIQALLCCYFCLHVLLGKF